MHPSPSQLKKLAAKLMAIFAIAIVAFGLAYWGLLSFPNHGLKIQEGEITLLDCLYFSIVTVATLGYGDIVPLGFSRVVASSETLFGLTFVGYAISQVVSAKQEAMVGYLARDRIVQTYDQCLAMVTDAKELIADRRRAFQAKVSIDPIDFIYNRANPFYPALRAMDVLNGYTAHVEDIGHANALSIRVERAAHHVEELASFTRKYVNLLISSKALWQTPRTKQILSQLCDSIDEFCGSYVIHTRYAKEEYKGGGFYRDIVQSLTKQIRAKL